MSALLHILIATALISGMILLRMFAERWVLRTRIRRDHADKECEKVGCFRGCERDSTEAITDSVTEKNVLKRSANHAP